MRHWVLSVQAVIALLVCGVSVMAADYEPVTDPAAVVISGQARFTVLTPKMIRMEWSPDGRFEDRASFAFVNRRLPVPAFQHSRVGEWMIIQTEALALRYRPGGGRFSASNTEIQLHVDNETVVWRPGDPGGGNLRGTTRTLDGVSGACPIDAGLVSRDGWVLVDDSDRPLFDAAEREWAAPRHNTGGVDWYFFGYGHDYKGALKDFTAVAGAIPLPPRYMFGAWWSRYWDYSDSELKALVKEFDQHDVPLDILVIDMGWHLPGWTGYSWNRELFPDPAGFLSWIHERGLRATLNLHPHNGVGKHEEQFAEMAKAMGVDPKSTDRIPFDCTDPQYMDAYFKYLHHPKEREGIDFWWMDWQQGESTDISGLDPLFWLNHLHWHDMLNNPDRQGKRPAIFSRWGGLGNHRYQVGFSGDTFCNWASLAFQPYFTSTAGNVGYGFWSHDIGGHQPGPVDPELYTRWIQFGVFSPALRTHTTTNPKAERRIWAFDREYFLAMREAFRLRYELLPYVYTAARQTHDIAVPVCRPMYYDWPGMAESYECAGQYMFGDDLLVAPVVAPADRISGCALVQLWLPPGEWTNWFTGKAYMGPSRVAVQVALDEIPLFVRSGAMIAASPGMKRTSEYPAETLVVHVFPGEARATRIYEDDGISTGYEREECAWIPVSHEITGDINAVVIGPEEGGYAGMPEQRTYEIRLRDVGGATQVLLDGIELAQSSAQTQMNGWWYDQSEFSVVVRVRREVGSTASRLEIVTTDEGLHGMVRAGLRGNLKALKDVGEIVGWPVERIEDLSPEQTVVAYEVAGTQMRVPDYAKIIPSLEVTPDVKRQALAKLLGLSFGAKACAQSLDGRRIGVNVGVSASPVVKGLSELRARLEVETPANWEMKGEPDGEASLAAGSSLLVSSDLVALEDAQTTVLKSKLHLESQQVQLEIPLETLLLPSIGRWWIVGPFDAPESDRLARVFGPEGKAIDLNATYAGMHGERIRWSETVRSFSNEAELTDEYFVEFQKVFGRLEYNAVAYALTYLKAPEDTECELAIGSDDGVVVWLNSVELFRHDVGRAYTPKEDRVSIKLKQGTNELLVKISQGGGMWGFCAHVEDEDESPLPQVTAHLRP